MIEQTQEPTIICWPFYLPSHYDQKLTMFFSFQYFGFLKSSLLLLEKHILHQKKHYFPGFLKFWQTFSFFPQKPHGKNALYIKILIEIAKAPKALKQCTKMGEKKNPKP